MASKVTSTRIPKKPLTFKNKKWTRMLSSATSGSNSPTATTSSSRVSPSKSPEPNCPICLGKIEDKSFANGCYHSFCRTCLFEWSKVKPECPVCRQGFDRIIYNIRAMDDYDEHHVELPRYNDFPSPFMSWHANLENNGVQRFRYPTTLTPIRRRIIDFERRLFDMNEFTRRFHQIGYLAAEQRRARLTGVWPGVPPANPRSVYVPTPYDLEIFPPPAGTSAHRKYIYDSDLWVLTNGDGNVTRTREVSHEFFAANPACTHRLIPWLNRELNALTEDPSCVSVLIPRLMDALLKYNITSRHFKMIIRPYIYDKTDHFIHEFYNFARSPYDMEHYSRIAVYVPRHRAQVVESEPLSAPLGTLIEPESPLSDSSSDSSVYVLSPRRSPNIFLSNVSSSNQTTTRSSRNATSISRNESPIFNLTASTTPATSVSSTEIREYLTPSPGSPVDLRTTNNIDPLSPSLPTPLPQADLDFAEILDGETIDFDNPQPGPSGLNRFSFRHNVRPQENWTESDTDVDVGRELEAALSKFERSENITNERDNKKDGQNYDSDTSSVLIVDYIKPRAKTPEVIDLLSESGDEKEDSYKKTKIKLKLKVKEEKKDKHKHGSEGHSSHGSKKKSKHKKHKKDKHHHKHHHKHLKYSNSSSSENSDDEWLSFHRWKRLDKNFKKRSSKEYSGCFSDSEDVYFPPLNLTKRIKLPSTNSNSNSQSTISSSNCQLNYGQSNNNPSSSAASFSSLSPGILPSVIGYHNLPSMKSLDENSK